MLPHNHICNLYVFIDDPAETLRNFEKAARNMRSLSRYSRANEINRQWTEEYLNEAHSFGLVPVRCHCNVMAWSEDRERLRNIRNDTGSALAQMGCKPRHNTVDAPTLYWAGIPGGRAIFPPRSLSIRSSNRRPASSSGRRTTPPPSLPSASRWRTGSVAGPSIWTSRTSR